MGAQRGRYADRAAEPPTNLPYPPAQACARDRRILTDWRALFYTGARRTVSLCGLPLRSALLRAPFGLRRRMRSSSFMVMVMVMVMVMATLRITRRDIDALTSC